MSSMTRAAELAEVVNQFVSAMAWLAALNIQGEPCAMDATTAERLEKVDALRDLAARLRADRLLS